VVNGHKSAAHTDSPDAGTGKTCLGGGMHCPSASSFCLTSSSRACALCDCSCPGVIYAGPMTLRETHRMIADSFALVSSATAPKTCTPILEVTSTHC